MAWTVFQRLYAWASGKRIGPAPGQLDLNAEFDHTYAGINQLGANMDAHKAGADHDGRYYTETETDTKIAQAAIGVIPLNSVNGNLLLNSTVTAAKLNFDPAYLIGSKLPTWMIPDYLSFAQDLQPFVYGGVHPMGHNRVIRFNTPLPTDVNITWNGSWYREWTDASEGGVYYANNTTSGTDPVSITFSGTAIAVMVAALTTMPITFTYSLDGGLTTPVTYSLQPTHLTHDVIIPIASGLTNGNIHQVVLTFTTPGQMYITGFITYTAATAATVQTTLTVQDYLWTDLIAGYWANGLRFSRQFSPFYVTVALTAPPTGCRVDLLIADGTSYRVIAGTDNGSTPLSSWAVYRLDARDFNYAVTNSSDSLTWLQKKPDGSPLVWPHAQHTRWQVNGFRRVLMSDVTKGPRYYADFLGQSAIQSSTADHFIQLSFVGTGLDLITYMGPTEGIFGYSVDGGTETLRDNYSATPAYQQKVRVANLLKYGTHQVKIRVTGTKAGLSTSTNVVVDGFEVRTPSPPDLPSPFVTEIPLAYIIVPPVDSRVPAGGIPASPVWPDSETAGWIRYESGRAVDVGAWTVVQDVAYSGGTAYQAVATATTILLSFTFVGYKVRVNARRFSAAGIMAVAIDGAAETNIDLYSATEYKPGVAFMSANLQHGVHTITIRQTGTKNASSTGNNITIDSFEVQQAPTVIDIRRFSPTQDTVTPVMQEHTDPINTPHPHRQYLRLQDTNTYVNRGFRSEISQNKVTAATTGAKSLVITFYTEFMMEPYVFFSVAGPSATGAVYGVTSLTTTGCTLNFTAPLIGDYYLSAFVIGL